MSSEGEDYLRCTQEVDLYESESVFKNILQLSQIEENCPFPEKGLFWTGTFFRAGGFGASRDP